MSIDAAIDTLKSLKDLMPPNGTERWVSYLLRCRTACLITAAEMKTIISILTMQGSVNDVALIR